MFGNFVAKINKVSAPRKRRGPEAISCLLARQEHARREVRSLKAEGSLDSHTVRCIKVEAAPKGESPSLARLAPGSRICCGLWEKSKG